ncbi:hypothetical protein [Sporolactobacillus terrae]|uniref:hypothetical protein n=1 Tax=Sporolactobacillus terrae TaxID=269673 RepID=UPI00048D6935|nr:hypothetical protein [Sporolactobacillus terrae]
MKQEINDDYGHINMALFFSSQSPEKRLIGNLVNQANEIIEHDGYTEDAKEIVQAIAILKHS